MTERYGASSTMQVPELKCKVLDHWTPKKRKEALSKTHATLNKRYGTKGNRTKQQEKAYAPLFEKRGKSRQKYIQDNPSKLAYYKVKTVKIKNRSFDVQGYEGEVLKYLVNQRKTPIKSITMYPLSIPYIEHGKNRIYIVDIKAKIQNKWYLIEVKGAYTAGLFKSGQTMFYNMRRKVRAAHEAGHRMKVIIFNEKTDTFCEIDNLHELTISQVRKLVLE